jgi:hypothetical protein
VPNRGALARTRPAVSTWAELLWDLEPLWPVVASIFIAFFASLVSGLLVVVALNGPLLTQSSRPNVQPELPSRVEVASADRLFNPVLIRAAPIATPFATPASTPIATVADEPSVDDAAWQAMRPSLDAVWGTDTPATLRLLQAFHARFPEFQPANEKLYAALVATAQDLAQRGASDDVEVELSLAIALLPERGEARAELLALNATPTLAAAADQQDQEQP